MQARCLAEWLRRAAAAAQAPLGHRASCVRAGAAAHGCFLAGRLLEMFGHEVMKQLLARRPSWALGQLLARVSCIPMALVLQSCAGKEVACLVLVSYMPLASARAREAQDGTSAARWAISREIRPMRLAR